MVSGYSIRYILSYFFSFLLRFNAIALKVCSYTKWLFSYAEFHGWLFIYFSVFYCTVYQYLCSWLYLVSLMFSVCCLLISCVWWLSSCFFLFLLLPMPCSDLHIFSSVRSAVCGFQYVLFSSSFNRIRCVLACVCIA